MPATALSGAPVLSTARNVSLRGGRDRKMKKPYPCIETKKADPEKRNQIRFFFVGGDDNKSSKYAGAEEGNRIASSYIVMVGDIDPLSGEIITQKMIDEYYKEEDKQIRTNLKFERRGFTNKEQAERRKIKKEFMETFRKEPIVDEIAEERRDITVGKVNVDDENALAMKYGVMSIPTLIVFQDGKEKARMVGVRPKAAILAELM